MEYISVVLIYFIYIVQSAFAGGCMDYNPIPGIITCLSNITYGINSTNVLAGTDTGTIRAYCEEGIFAHSIECLAAFYRIKDGCSTSEAGLHLSMPNNMPATLNISVHKLCTSLPEHAKHSNCIVEQRPAIQACLGRNDAIFQQKQNEQLKSSRDETVTNICRFYKGIEVCTGKYVENRCDRSMGIMLGQFIRNVTPLKCSITINSKSASVHIEHHSFTNIFVLSALSLFHLCFVLNH